MNDLNHNAVIRMKDLVRLVSLSRSTIYEKLNPKSKWHDPKFPNKIMLGDSAIGFRIDDVLAWLKANELCRHADDGK